MKFKTLQESLGRLGEDAFITNSPYDIKNLIMNKPKLYRILYDPNIDMYMIGDGNRSIHRDLMWKAYLDGYYPELDKADLPHSAFQNYWDAGCEGMSLKDLDEVEKKPLLHCSDGYDHVWPFLIFMVFSPDENQFELGEDGYEQEYTYDFGTIYTRECYLEDCELYGILQRFSTNNGELNESLSNKDSGGRTLTTQQLEFFKNSKVVDNQGRLLVCYHGTKSDFDTFDKKRIGSNYKGFSAWGKGFYFISDKTRAKQWASFDSSKGINNSMFTGGFDSDAKAMEVYLNITNPYVDYETKDERLIEFALNNEKVKAHLEGFRLDQGFIERNLLEIMQNAGIDVTEVLKQFGYDGVICEYNTGRKEIVAYEPNQIKSITNENPSDRDSINEDWTKDGKIIWYRGYDSRYSPTDDKENNSYTWVTADLEYASEYGDKVAAFTLKCDYQTETGSADDLDNEYCDYLDPDEDTMQDLYKQGLYGYSFEADDYTCLCIKKDMIELLDADVDVNTLNESLSNRDNEGAELTPEQAEFFRNSKIRNMKGELIRCYHGSEASFDTFDKSKIGTGNGAAMWGRGFYFATYDDIAGDYGEVKDYYLNITNPFRMDVYGSYKQVVDLLIKHGAKIKLDVLKDEYNNLEDEYMEDMDLADILYDIWDDKGKSSMTMISEVLQKEGYDGIWMGEEVIAFEPNQIKAIDNKNPTDKDNINEKFVLDESLFEDANISLLDKAKNWFGTTNSFKSAGYLNTDGTMLDLSGRKFGGSSTNRSVDHREIAYVMDDNLEPTECMYQYMRQGNIRLKPEAPGLEMIIEPTKNQYEMIRRYAAYFFSQGYDEFYVDFSNEKGDTVGDISYDKYTIRNIISDIKKRFNQTV